MPRQIYPLPRSILDEYKGLPLYLSLSPSTLLTDFSTLLGLYQDIGPLSFLAETIHDDEFGPGYLRILDRIRNYPAKAGGSWNANTAKHRYVVLHRFVTGVIFPNLSYRNRYLAVVDETILRNQFQSCIQGINLDISELKTSGEFDKLSPQLSSKWISWSDWLLAGRHFVEEKKKAKDLASLQAICMFYLFQQRCRRLELLSLTTSTTRPAEENYVLDDDSTIVLNKYKTFAVYDQYQFKMKAHVKKAFLRLKATVSTYPEMRYYFGTPTSPLSVPSTLKMQQLNKMICGVELSVDNLRHMYFLHMNPKDKVGVRQVSNQMGTSPEQLNNVYHQQAPKTVTSDYQVTGSVQHYDSRTYCNAEQERILRETYNELWGPLAPEFIKLSQWALFLTRNTETVTNDEIRLHFGDLYKDRTKARKSMLHWGRLCAKKMNVPY